MKLADKSFTKEELTDEEKQILKLIKDVDYGKIVITVRNKIPVHAEIQKSIPIK